MKSNVVIQKKNEVYLTVHCEPHVHELANPFAEVPQEIYVGIQKEVLGWKIKLFSPATGEIYVGLFPYITAFARKRV